MLCVQYVHIHIQTAATAALSAVRCFVCCLLFVRLCFFFVYVYVYTENNIYVDIYTTSIKLAQSQSP